MALNFTSPPPTRGKTVTFTLDDDEYEFVTPKSSVLTMAMVRSEKGGVGQLRGLLTWLEAGMDPDQFRLLTDRLADPDDGLDNDTLGAIAKALLAEVTDRPTSSQPG